MENISIIDRDYQQWLRELSARYRTSQVKAAIRVNREMLKFYCSLGHDIVEMHAETRWGEKVIRTLSNDLKSLNPSATCFSRTNLYYMKKFYLVSKRAEEIVQQVVGQTDQALVQQAVGQLWEQLLSIPWGHHILLMTKCGDDVKRMLFYARETVENGWSRAVLLNMLSTDLYEREGKALTNFKATLPAETSDLAQEITRDPYNFAFTGITKRYNERLLKDKLMDNITKFLTELGTGFAYVGREYRLNIGESENFIDLLFFHINLNCYIIVECKITKLDFRDVGQLSGYVVAANHLLRKEGQNPTIGLLICKEKDNLVAKYAVESSSQPIGISEYELSKLYPAKVDGEIPTIEEIEEQLSNDGIDK